MAAVLVLLAGCGDGAEGAPEVRPGAATGCSAPSDCPAPDVTLSGCQMPLFNYRVPTGQSEVPAEWEPLGSTPVTTNVFLQAFFCEEARIGGTAIGRVFFAVLGGDSANAPDPPESTADFWFWGYGIVAFTDSGALLDHLQRHGMKAESASGEFASSTLETLGIDGAGWSIRGECGTAQGSEGRMVGELFLYHGPRADPILFDILYEGDVSRIEGGVLMAEGGSVGAQLEPAGATASVCGNHRADAVVRFLDWP